MFPKNNILPDSLLGLWTDKHGKRLLIRVTGHHYFSVSVFDAEGEPYAITLLGNAIKPTVDLRGKFEIDIDGNRKMTVEAGTEGIGPTYDFYFAVHTAEAKYRPAVDSDDVSQICILPNVGIGLYDDWDDDLGVSWAFPLDEFQKCP